MLHVSFRDVSCFDLHISHYVTRGWPGRGPAHPGLFQDFFTTIVQRLAGDNRLTVFATGTSRDYLDELEVIEHMLLPRRLSYMVLPSRRSTDPTWPDTGGHLFFEWPLSDLDVIVHEHWLHYAPNVKVEGYISSRQIFDLIATLYFRDDSIANLQALLRQIEFGFRVWSDGNGLFIATEKRSANELEARLKLDELRPQLELAVQKYVND